MSRGQSEKGSELIRIAVRVLEMPIPSALYDVPDISELWFPIEDLLGLLRAGNQFRGISVPSGFFVHFDFLSRNCLASRDNLLDRATCSCAKVERAADF